jgi:diacylglycerol kinase family enzyme
MPGIGIIANPHSQLNKRSPAGLSALQAIAGQKGIFTVTRDLDHLDETLLDYRERKIKLLAINGGDGTVSQAITRMIAIYGKQQLPTLAVLGGGTMNLVASQLSMSGSPAEILKKIIASDPKDYTVETLETLKIKDVYGFLYADQSSTAILEEFYRKKSGQLGAVWLAAKITSSFIKSGSLFRSLVKPAHLQARFQPSGAIDEEVLGCFAGTIHKFPLGIPFLPLARRYPGQFQMMAVTCKAERLLWYMPLLMFLQKEGEGFGKISLCCKEAELTYAGPVSYTIDGEIYSEPTGRLVIEAGPTLRFLMI